MQLQSNETKLSRRQGKTLRGVLADSLPSRADEVLISVAILALAASASDGEPDEREIECLLTRFGSRFALSSRATARYVTTALERMRRGDTGETFDHACATLAEHLTLEQRLALLDDLADIIVADMRVDELEEFFLDHVARKLQIVSSLSDDSPSE
ncbi:MAG: TerB family tellurite resistance protein [Bdellovibrionota bacterium]